MWLMAEREGWGREEERRELTANHRPSSPSEVDVTLGGRGRGFVNTKVVLGVMVNSLGDLL